AGATVGTVRDLRVPTPDSHPADVAVGSDGAVWFTELAPAAIARLQGRTFTTFPLLASSEPTAIVAGPDGDLWFAEYAADRIGRITTAGQVTEFDIPLCHGCSDVGPWDIAVGSDGALWFTEIDADRIGRITTAGAITQFDLPGAMGHPVGITNGPD